MAKRKQYCLNCGDFLGEYDSFGEQDSCGKAECDKAQRDSYRDEQDRRREEAERDNYERY